MDRFISILFIIIEAYLLLQILLLKKTDEKQSVIKWLFISMIFIMCYHAAFVGLYRIVRIPINLVSVGIFDLLVSAGLTFLNLKQRQKYYISIYDIISLATIIVIVIVCGFAQFGNELKSLNFETSDPANHLKYAMDLSLFGKIYSMYLYQLNCSLILSTIIPFLGKFVSVYRIYILCEMLGLFFAGGILYTLISEFAKTKIAKLLSIFLIVAYMLGYPRNSMIFGFGYLSYGVTICGVALMFTVLYTKKTINKWIAMVGLGCSLFGILVSYVMFAPPMFAGIFFAILYNEIKNKENIKRILVKILCIFIIPGAFGSYFFLIGTFSNKTPMDVLTINGYFFIDLFIGTLPILPFALAGAIRGIVRRKNVVYSLSFFMLIGYMVLMFIGGMKELISAYYFSKTYYLLYLILFWGMGYYISTLSRRNFEFVVSYFLTCMFVVYIYSNKIEENIRDVNNGFNNKVVSDVFFSVYKFNDEKAEKDGMDDGKMQLYDWVNENLSDEDVVPMAAYYVHCFWYEAMSRHRDSEYAYYSVKAHGQDYLKEIANADYIIVDTSSDVYMEYKDYFDSLMKLYQNNSGFVAQIQ